MGEVTNVYGLKTDSLAYSLVQHAMNIAVKQSIGHAKDFLGREMRLNNLKYWEQSAIANCFTQLVKDCNKIFIEVK